MSAVDEVKARLDIVDVVGGYVRLQKAGRYFKGLCPFHTEKTPSFLVYPDRQSWHCFGACATGGDVITFVSRKENLDFSGALRLLADRAGVELRSDGPRREEIKTLQDANEAAALYFHGLLSARTPQRRAPISRSGASTRSAIERLPASATRRRAGTTCADHLTRPRLRRGAADRGRPAHREASAARYDRFRDRLMFPIRDDRGRVVGFGGRVLPGRTKTYDERPEVHEHATDADL